MKPAGEDDILSIVDRHFPRVHPSLLLGRGDDCAVLRPSGPLAVSTDIFVEDSHFRRRYFTPCDIGFKALAVNLSDIGAAGARPTGFSIGLTLTGREDAAWLDAFCEGMAALSRRFDLCVSGGDLSRSALLNVCITAWGELPAGLPQGLRRGVAKEGDLVILLGDIGLARLGLAVLEQTLSDPDASAAARVKALWPEACSRHLRPQPLVREGALLGRFAVEHDAGERLGLMDVSDGLARDLPRLLASPGSGLGAELFLPEQSLHSEVRTYAESRGLDAAAFALEGGEDYALACTCPQALWPDLRTCLQNASIRPLVLGQVRKGPFFLNGKLVVMKGFDHFGA
ncbi:thiamine-phosphate kinase [uncultured Mailhella sp.]|uniref:thiamine-phosphate kinase n=1 Tax=uncultured Mailhella sp. TaxID=1981031 RepID=UPI002607A115|nr:thiamine-phosphate kinase [uncultured Mailhella sp.]